MSIHESGNKLWKVVQKMMDVRNGILNSIDGLAFSSGMLRIKFAGSITFKRLPAG